MNHKLSFRKHLSKRGFTLVELLVSVTILGILIFSIVFIFNPLGQFSKAYDGQRKQDLNQIRLALDSYYNDNNCYPTSIPFGEEWKDEETDEIYMKKVPQDPFPFLDRRGEYGYNYDVDQGKACPQWNILFAQLMDKSFESGASNEKSCLGTINKINNQCIQMGYTNVRYRPAYNYCIFSGSLDCEALADQTSPNPYTPSEDPNPEPTNPVPTVPPGGSCLKAQAKYSCRVGQNPGNQCVSGGVPEAGVACNDVGVGNGDFCDSNCNGDLAQ